jgi:hypothetical protein
MGKPDAIRSDSAQAFRESMNRPLNAASATVQLFGSRRISAELLDGPTAERRASVVTVGHPSRRSQDGFSADIQKPNNSQQRALHSLMALELNNAYQHSARATMAGHVCHWPDLGSSPGSSNDSTVA